MGKVRDFEFGARIDHRAWKLANTKVGERGYGVRTCTYYNFGTECVNAKDFKFGVQIDRQACKPTTEK